MHADLESILCKFGGDPAICLREEAICAKVYRQRDDGRRAIALAHSWYKSQHMLQHPNNKIAVDYNKSIISLAPRVRFRQISGDVNRLAFTVLSFIALSISTPTIGI